MQVDFYHLTTAPLERVLPRIATRVLDGGGRLLIVTQDEARLAALDRLLWTFSADSFLPHARAGTGNDADQPILLSGTLEAANGARNIAIADGMWRAGALHFDRAFHFFDDDQIHEARAAWKGLAGREGLDRHYWKQNDEGRWQQA